MLKKDEIRRAVRQAIDDVRRTNPMAPSITNTVTINLVANVQLAIGGSAAMVYMPDEGEAISAAVVTVSGGSKFMPMITGAGCSLGGAMAIYACCATPFIAALTSTMMFDFAGRAAEDSDATHGPGSFQVNFLDELYRAGAAEVADMNISVEEAER